MSILFFAFWIALNGRLTMEVFCFGLAISAGASWFVWKFLDDKPR